MKQYMLVMGLECKDKVTGFVGFVECVSFDLYGCVQVALRPKIKEDGSKMEPGWFDHKRLEILNHTPVMELPNFELAEQKAVSSSKQVNKENGPAHKPEGRFR